MYTLGINAAFHDSAACLVDDGRVVAAAEEERFTRIKHGKRPTPFSAYELPFHAIDYCLHEADLTMAEVEHVAYSFQPSRLLGRHRREATITLPLEPSAGPVPDEWLGPWDPLFLASIVNAPRHLAGGAPHHLQARFRGIRHDGPFRWHFIDHHLAHAASALLPSPFEHAAVLTLDGRGERTTTVYWLGQGMRLKRLGRVCMPHSLGLLYEDVTRHLGFLHSSDEYKVMALASFGRPRYLDRFRRLVRVEDGGRYTIDRLALEEWFGPPRRKGEPLEEPHFDLAHSLQAVLEESVLELARWLHKATGAEDLCLAGGVALNCVMNARLRDEGPFRRVWVQPAAGDAGTALGAAMWIDAVERKARRRRYRMDHAFLGPDYDDDQIEEFLRWSKLPYRKMKHVAEAGSAPAVAARRRQAPSPFMLFVYRVRPEKAARIPAVRHVDGTARIQTIHRRQNAAYYDLLKAFARRTGVPVLVNTSFNTRGEPIVASPRDAVECFWTSPLDALVIGSFLLEKRTA